MKMYGRIVCCGMIAAYNQGDQPPPVHHLWEVVARQLRMQGFLLLARPSRASTTCTTGCLRRAGRAGERDPGIANAGEAFSHLMAGSTMGKTLIELDLPEARLTTTASV